MAEAKTTQLPIRQKPPSNALTDWGKAIEDKVKQQIQAQL